MPEKHVERVCSKHAAMEARVAVLESQVETMTDLPTTMATVKGRLGVLQWLVGIMLGTNLVGVVTLILFVTRGES